MVQLITLRKTRAFSVLDPISLQAAAVLVLSTAHLQEKADLSFLIVSLWQARIIREVCHSEDSALVVPTKPSRPVTAGGNSDKQTSWPKVSPVVNAIHGIAHAESWAMDLFWDCIARYARGCDMPFSFYDELVTVAGQEAKHFCDWNSRLESYSCPYGTLPTHDGLWRCAEETSHDLTARLAIVNLVYEARGLDTYALTLKKFEKAGDSESVTILKRNYLEEIQHVEKGLRWFKYKCLKENKDPLETFSGHVRQYHPGPLKGPFNEAARTQAGMSPEWYEPLTAVPAPAPTPAPVPAYSSST
jgi:uncharacterized ferritin-like protein (DUF455 family)